MPSKTKDFGAPTRIGHDARAYYETKLYAAQPLPSATELPAQPLPEQCLNTIFNHSAEQMRELPDRSVHLVITSPPYNVGKVYDADLSLTEYLAFLKRVWQECERVLVEGGRLCVNVANLGRKPYLPIASYVTQALIELGLLMRGEIIWSKGASAGVSMAWGSWQSAANPVLRDTHEYILVFSKGKLKREGLTGSSTITREQFMEWTKSVWTMCTESAKRIGHPAPFPVELPYRLLQLYSFAGDVVLDPFMGSGTTGLAAIQSNRRFVGYEVEATYCALAQQRLEPALLFAQLGEHAAKSAASLEKQSQPSPKEALSNQSVLC